jgi:iron-sulfur cluster repair protein YtfE (RIC family)
MGGTAQASGDVIDVLLTQHARIRELFGDVKTATGEHKQQAFDELRALLAVHETAEEMILRPVSAKVAGAEIAAARNEEEKEANHVLAGLERMDVTTPDFDRELAAFQQAVEAHAQNEEAQEFPRVRSGLEEGQLTKMAAALQAVEAIAPTHPHPSTAGSPTAQWVVGPFASIVDRTRDALTKVMSR